jgi:SAM-dependent methyltransferase
MILEPVQTCESTLGYDLQKRDSAETLLHSQGPVKIALPHVQLNRTVRMRRNGILSANWYDYPQYYDIAFQAHTRAEADFIETACRKYCPFDARRLLEPACGTGRLITEFAARGYQVTGFDISSSALTYLRRRLERRRLHAETFEAQMSDFRVAQSADAAYCMVNTFRHLLTEQAARSHLQCIVSTLRPGGIYVVGMNLLPSGAARWAERRGKTKVTITESVLRTDVRRRIEDVEVCLTVRRGSNEFRLRHEYKLRTYTRTQFRRLLASVPSLELRDTYDVGYDIDRPLLKDEVIYRVLVLSRRSLS